MIALDLRCSAMCLVALWACGGSSANVASTPTPIADPAELPHTMTLQLEAGELVLGADSPDAGRVSYAIRARDTELVLVGCDLVEAQTSISAFELGPVEFGERSQIMMLSGAAERSRWERLASEPAPRLRTCDEEIDLSPSNVMNLRAFLEGRPQEELQSCSVSVIGLSLSFAVASVEEDVVRMELYAEVPHNVEDDEHDGAGTWHPEPGQSCDVEVIVNDRTAKLDTAEYQPSVPHRPAHFDVEVQRPYLQIIAAQEHVGLMLCGHIYAIDAAALAPLKELVGAPEEGAELPLDPEHPADLRARRRAQSRADRRRRRGGR